VKVLEATRNRFDRFNQVAQQREVIDRGLRELAVRRESGKEDVGDVAQMAKLRPARVRIHEIDGDVLVGTLHVRRAAGERDDVPFARLEQVSQQVASHHAGRAGNERFSSGHARAPEWRSMARNADSSARRGSLALVRLRHAT
jgi:hypothetical protein